MDNENDRWPPREYPDKTRWMIKERGLPLPDPNDPSWRQWLTFLFGRPRPRDYDRSRAK